MRVIVEADGGSRGNPGPAGYGALVRAADTGDVLVTRSAALGVSTNNVAEYSGLIAGLRAAVELGADEIDVRLDSKLVVEQMSGRWKIKHAALRSLADEAGQLAAGCTRVDYQWIPRADNADADRLANEAMDAAERGESDGAANPVPASGAAPAPAAAVTGPQPDTSGGPMSDPHGSTAPPASSNTTSGPATPWLDAGGNPTRLFLVRHGQTAMSVETRYSGRGDVPLTERGRQQAAAIAKRLAGAGLGDGVPVVSSPLARAASTAEAIADSVGSTVDTRADLTETDFGAWEGLTFGEAAARDPQRHRAWLSDTTVAPQGGESFEEVGARVRAACDGMLSDYPGRDVVVVTHVTPIKMLLRLALDAGPALLYRLHLDVASLSVVEFYPDGNTSVRLVNDTSHL